jgi:hypothetical protein
MTRFLFLATIFCVTFEKVHWSIGGTLTLADVLTRSSSARSRSTGSPRATASSRDRRHRARVRPARSSPST